MSAHMTDAAWKSELNKPANKGIKKTGISEALRNYDKALTSSPAEVVKALDALIKTGKTIANSYPTRESLCAYLDKLTSEAATERKKWSSQLGNSGGSSADAIEDLIKGLNLAKTITDSERALNFVCAPGKTTGLFVSKTAITMGHVGEVKAQRGKGKGGPVVRGLLYGENSKLVFDFGEEPPIKGIAKALQKTVKVRCELPLKVIARGAGLSLEEEHDIDAEFENDIEQPTGPTDVSAEQRKVLDQGANYVSREDWDRLLTDMQKLPPAQREAMLDSVLGLARRDTELLSNDRTVSRELKSTRIQIIQDAVKAAKRLAQEKPGAPQPVTAPQRASVTERRDEIHALMSKNVVFIDKAVFAKGSAAALARRPELMLDGSLNELQQALQACEGGKTAQNLNAVRDACDRVDARLDRLRELDGRGFANGDAEAALNRQDIDIDANFAACAKLYAACEQDPTPKNVELLRKACAHYLTALEKALSKAQGPAQQRLKDKITLIQTWHDGAYARLNRGALSAQGKASLQARTEARLAEIAAAYKALGPPQQWTRKEEELAAELEAAYLFEEGTVSSGASFGASALGGEGGVNAAFWIKREDSDGKNSADKLFIFKPFDAEADVAHGLPAGSGAVREVLAKDLADSLAASGLKVDVCPTNLVRIDTRKLPDTEGKTHGGPPRMGAMQRLAADTQGSIGGLGSADPTLLSRIDKKEYDQLAVYDLIIGNLDRHGGNILLSGDLAGTPHLVPIDHGTSMPGPQTLKLNRHRILNPQNVLMGPDMEQGDQPLSAEARSALLSIKPSEMAQSLRDAQSRLAERHPELGDPALGLDDAQIKLMERSVRFMQAGADTLSVRDMFEIKSQFSDELMRDPEPDWKALVGTLKTRLDAWRKDVNEVGKLVPTDAASAAFPVNVLQDLGWCMGMSPKHAQQWVIDNPERAHKILAGQIANPRLGDEVAELRNALGKQAASVESDPAKLSYREQMRELQAAMAHALSADAITDPAQLRQEYQTLGGDRVLAEMLAFCSADRDTIEPLQQALRDARGESERADAAMDLYMAQIERLRYWRSFVMAGGVGGLARLGGLQTPTARDAYRELISLKAQQEANRDVDGIGADEVKKRQTEILGALAKDIQTEILKLIAAGLRLALQKRLDDLVALEKSGDLTAAQGGMALLAAQARTEVEREAGNIKLHRDDVTSMQSTLGKATDVSISNELKLAIAQLAELEESAILDDATLARRRAVLKSRLDFAIKGDQSTVGKYRTRIAAFETALADIKASPRHDVIRDSIAGLKTLLDTFDFDPNAFEARLTATQRARDHLLRTEQVRKDFEKVAAHPDANPVRDILAKVDRLWAGLDLLTFDATVLQIGDSLVSAATLVRKMQK